MKKIISIFISISLMIGLNYSTNADNFTLSAVVGNSNHSPVVTEIRPNLTKNYLEHSEDGRLEKQNYSIKFRDDENDDITYTITTESDGGTVTPTNGTITSSDYDSNNEAYILFEYITPLTAVGDREITITISDGPNVTTQTLYVYIY